MIRDLAIAYESLGDTNRSLDAISTALERHEFNATMIKTDPTFKSLHSNGRFRELMGPLKTLPAWCPMATEHRICLEPCRGDVSAEDESVFRRTLSAGSEQHPHRQ
jgi:hypothetical protein